LSQSSLSGGQPRRARQQRPQPAWHHNRLPSAVGATAFVWVPGWNFLGATYDAAWAIPVGMFAAGNPVNVEASGMINTFIAPVELSWKFGDSGFYVKTGLGMYVPDGTVTGVNGLGNLGNEHGHPVSER